MVRKALPDARRTTGVRATSALPVERPPIGALQIEGTLHYLSSPSLPVGAIEQLETALYFSFVTFTTLGYGDVTLPPDWRRIGPTDITTPAEDAASRRV
jgi:hypothetical protein